MPFLPPEPFVSPGNLFDADSLGGDDHRWWVLHTRPLAEKALARQLSSRGLRFFLPLYKKHSRINGRSYEAYIPLFAGYLFLHGDGNDRIQALETNQVAQVIHVEDQPQLRTDLGRIHSLMTANVDLTPEERLQPGTVVEIVAGPLIGMKGKVITRHKKTRFLVEVKFLQQGASVDVERWMIEPIGNPLVSARA